MHAPDDTPRNVLGGRLLDCSHSPLTGWFRDGCCRHDSQDGGRHLVCALLTAEFLEFSQSRGNGLSTPRPEFEFPGLKPGDRWCLCTARWEEARLAGCAPLVVLEATAIQALESLDLAQLRQHAAPGPS